MKNLKNLRKLNGLTQEELARQLGVNQTAVASWERGASYPTADKLPEIAKVLNCKIDDLYTEETVKEAV